MLGGNVKIAAPQTPPRGELPRTRVPPPPSQRAAKGMPLGGESAILKNPTIRNECAAGNGKWAEGGAGVARAWRGRGAGYRLRLGMSDAGVARAWRGHGAEISCSPRVVWKTKWKSRGVVFEIVNVATPDTSLHPRAAACHPSQWECALTPDGTGATFDQRLDNLFD
eukprot:gene24417-biopygen19419